MTTVATTTVSGQTPQKASAPASAPSSPSASSAPTPVNCANIGSSFWIDVAFGLVGLVIIVFALWGEIKSA